MRVGVLIDGVEYGGAEILAERWVARMRESWDVTMVPYPGNGEVPSLLRAGRWRGMNLAAPQVSRSIRGMGSTLRSWLEAHDLDVLVAQQDLVTRLIVLEATKVMQTLPVLLVEHSRLHWWNFLPPARGAYRRVASAPHVRTLAVAGEVKKDLVRVGVPPDRITVVRNSANLRDVPAGDPRAPRVVTWSRIVPKKGIDDLIRMVARLREGGLEVPCLVFGSGPDEARLHRLADKLGVDHLVQLGGFEKDPLQRVSSADIFVTLSRDPGEGLPLRLLEAMGAGLACVTTDVGGVKEIVEHSANGFVVRPRDVTAAVAAVSALVRDERLRAAIGAAGKQTIADYSHETALDGFMDTVRSLVAAREQS